MPTESIEYQIRVQGGEEAARTLAAIERATAKNTAELKKASGALSENAGASAKSADATDKATAKFSTFGSTLGLAGQAAGRFNPILGATISAAGQATGVIQTLTTAGLGPFGIAIASASAAVGLLSPIIAQMTSEADAANEAFANRLNKTLEDFIGLAESAATRQALLDRLARGEGGVAQQSGTADAARNELDIRARVLTSRLGAVGMTGQANAADLGSRLSANASRARGAGNEDQARQYEAAADALGELDSATRNYTTRLTQLNEARGREANAGVAASLRSEAEAENALANKRDEFRQRQQRHHGARGHEHDIEIERIRAELALVEKLSEIYQRSYEENISIIGKQNEAERLAAEESLQIAEQAAALRQKLADEEAAAEQRRIDKALQNTESLADRYQEEQQRIEEAWKQTWDSGKASMSAFGRASAEALAQAVAGGGDVAGAFVSIIDKKLEALAISETVEGLSSLAVAVGNSLFNPALAGAKYAESGLHFAAAAAAGGASAAIPNAPASAGGGAAESRPTRDAGGGSDAGGPTTIIYQQGGDIITAATEAQVGRSVGRVARRAARLERT